MGIATLMTDERKIESIFGAELEGGGGMYYTTRNFNSDGDSSSYESITPYYENGEMAGVVWFALIKDDKIVRRFNSKFVSEVKYVDD